jgi:hypothetical protein
MHTFLFCQYQHFRNLVKYVRFKILTAVTMKKMPSRDVVPIGLV